MESGETPSYNPYEFRTSGTVSDFAAFLHLVKGAFGTGVLTMPYAFKNAGMVLGFVFGIAVAVICVYCFHMLLKIMVSVSGKQSTPYSTFPDVVIYSFNNANKCCASISSSTSIIIDYVLCLYHFGICTAYINYLVLTTLTMAGYKQYSFGPINFMRSWVTMVWVIPLFVVNMIRDLKTMMPLSLIGNLCTVFSMLIIVYYVVTPGDDGFSSTWENFGTLETAPLFIGTMFFAVESFGVIIAVEKSMSKPAHFLGKFGVFNFSMFVVVSWYLFIGAFGYWKYGIRNEPTIVMSIPQGTLQFILELLVAVGLFCSYPLQCYVIMDIIWGTHIEPKLSKHKLAYEYVFRFFITALTGIVALTIPRLDLIISLTGAACLSFLGVIIPGILEFNYCRFFPSGTKSARVLTATKDVLIILFGVFTLVVGSYSALYGFIKQLLGGGGTPAS